MENYELIQVAVLIILLIFLSPILGKYIAAVIGGDKYSSNSFFKRIETHAFKILGVDFTREMDWKEYTISIMIFNSFGILFLTLLLVFQNLLPLNPQKLSGVELSLALNTAVSFVTNTNWQSYAGEITLSYFVQMIGLTVQNFLSAATGIAVLIVFIRGLITKKGSTLGNFWADLARIVIYMLLPLSLILSIILMQQGSVQSLSPYKSILTIEGKTQTIPLGPAASQIAIKQLGTNGGGFFNANSSFPFENPTPLSNFLQIISILLIPGSLVFAYGYLIGNKKHAWIIFGVMLFLFSLGFIVSLQAEYSYNNIYHLKGIMEGKETRFGILNSVLWSTATTAASNGSVNAMHSSLSPLAGMISLLNIQLGEIIFGGVGSGLYGMLLFIFITVFIVGLMIGRTPEFLGKKIESFEIKWTIIAVLVPNLVILSFTSLSLVIPTGLKSILNNGPHGFTEILYAFSSAAGNNGSAFAGLNTNTTFYNLMMAAAMLIGRFGVIIPCMIISGNMVKKNITPYTQGTLRTDTFLFALFLISVILIIGALTFFPSLMLGPILEHFLMQSGILL